MYVILGLTVKQKNHSHTSLNKAARWFGSHYNKYKSNSVDLGGVQREDEAQ